MTDHSFNQEKKKRYQSLVEPAIAKTHIDADHKVIGTKYAVACATCNLHFGVSLPYDQHFGYAVQICVTGDGSPFATAVIDEIRDIVYGTHKRFGIGSGKLSDRQRRRKYERAVRYLVLMLDELAIVGSFDSIELEVKAQKMKSKLQEAIQF